MHVCLDFHLCLNTGKTRENKRERMEKHPRSWVVRRANGWPGSVSHRRVHKFTTPSHKDSLRSAVSIYSLCRGSVIEPRGVPVFSLSRVCVCVPRIGVYAYTRPLTFTPVCKCNTRRNDWSITIKSVRHVDQVGTARGNRVAVSLNGALVSSSSIAICRDNVLIRC